jgi:hypothetical protein
MMLTSTGRFNPVRRSAHLHRASRLKKGFLLIPDTERFGERATRLHVEEMSSMENPGVVDTLI